MAEPATRQDARQDASSGFRAPFYLAQRGDRKIWLLGTFHVGRAEWYPLRPEITNALKRSDRLMTETGAVDPARLMAAMMPHALCNPPCLEAALTQRTRAALSSFLQRQGRAPSQFARMRPWWAGLLLDGLRLRDSGYHADWGVEAVLTQLAPGKPHLALEMPEALAQVMADMDDATADEFLFDVLRDDEAVVLHDTEALASLWKAGDAEALYDAHLVKLEEGGLARYAKFLTGTLLHQRNHRFMQAMLAQATTQRTLFVAVGALHLGGPEGMLQLLRDAGWRVIPR